MRADYADIRSRINEDPKWWDEHGVPRYCEFTPAALANIYAHECCLVLIACQNCGRLFEVAMSRDSMDYARRVGTLAECIATKQLEYRDPPNVGCCAAGPTMTSNMLRVFEFWRDGGACQGWVRVPEFEVELEDA